MLVLLVRHGHAGTKRQWAGDDKLRPLDAQGLAEAQALVTLMVPWAPARILSSPFLRCAQSMAPLAQALGTKVGRSSSLTPDAGTAARKLVLSVSSRGSGAVVLCTHGEVIHDLQSSLGKQAPPNFNAHAPREKASIWVLERSAGRFVSANYVPPPSVAAAASGADGEDDGDEALLSSAHP